MNNEIKFDADRHEYKVNGVTYISATTLMKEYGLSVDYGTIPDAVLKKAAQKGKAIHKALEEHILGDTSMISLFDEVKMFDDYIRNRGIDPTTLIPEEIIADNKYQVAGTVDLQYVDGNDDVLADFKTTSALHMDAVAWQLSIYNYIKCKGDVMKYYFKKLKVFHFTGNRFRVVDIYTVEYDAVVALMETWLKREPVFNYVKPNKVILPTEEQLLTQIVNEIAVHKQAIEALDKEQALILSRVKDNFVKQKDYSFTNGVIDIKYVAPITRTSLNQKKAKEFITDNGGRLEDFMNTTTSADKATVKLSKKTKQADDADAID